MPKHPLGRHSAGDQCAGDQCAGDQVMGKQMGTMGNNALPAAPTRAAHLERTTGFEPATLTLAKKGD